jgi:hypothetical protein
VSASIIVVLCIAVLYWHGRFRADRDPSIKGRSRKIAANRPSGPYQAVSIKHGSCACSGVELYTGKRYLTSEAPLLPIPSCDADQCKCRYVRHRDRRMADERRNLYSIQAELYAADGKVDRRRNPGRRKSDREEVAEEDFGFQGLEWVK